MRIDPLHLRAAEEILIGGEVFDSERRAFIANMNTVDLLAVPGSGKTTALLAKLYCMAKQMPLDTNRAVLILCHTNHAIEEIEKVLKPLCPQLFVYPNFVGTIQSFTNKFVANQACFDLYGSYIHKNDDQMYLYEVERFFKSLQYSEKGQNPANLKNKLFGLVNRDFEGSSNEKERNILEFLKNCSYDLEGRKVKIGNTSKLTYTGVNREYYLELERWKLNLLSQGILSFKDSFDISKSYLNLPCANDFKEILQNRFRYVFIDEMQDLDFDQVQLIESIFFTEGSTTIIQRIGDQNQAIYSSSSLHSENVWRTRNQIDPERFQADLSLNNSHRLTPIIGELVDGFALSRSSEYRVVGISNRESIPPHLLIFKDETHAKMLKERYIELIKHFGLNENSTNIEKGFHIIAWTTDKEEGSEKWHLRKLFPEYSREIKQKREDFDCLRKYLFLFDRRKSTFEAVRKSLLNGIIRILRIEGVNIPGSSSKKYSKSIFVDLVKSKGDAYYDIFKGRLFNWCYSIIVEENYQMVFDDYVNYIRNQLTDLIEDFKIQNSEGFINREYNFNFAEILQPEQIEDKGIIVKLGSVHSAKGQTHCATMYVETDYHTSELAKLTVFIKGKKNKADFVGCNPLFFQEQNFSHLNKVRSNETLKMMYVGFSRPTDLLCFAIRRDNVRNDIEKFKNAGWTIVPLDE
ncbi:UvrD-helicase domain-containing protein [uncultured Chryseobacterium sp.]|uniref:UvrD-helicase domain-containing protein n=1 Tax=uncultured Chryseobacterium sp. TaxID=259322 RepID=UPI0025D8E3B5|nr:UvrD-helicase domain-containing protein [uncultured Chryseobacterium sp.]